MLRRDPTFIKNKETSEEPFFEEAPPRHPRGLDRRLGERKEWRDMRLRVTRRLLTPPRPQGAAASAAQQRLKVEELATGAG